MLKTAGRPAGGQRTQQPGVYEEEDSQDPALPLSVKDGVLLALKGADGHQDGASEEVGCSRRGRGSESGRAEAGKGTGNRTQQNAWRGARLG